MNDDVLLEREAGKHRAIRFLTHFLCLCILFVLPEILMDMSRPNDAPISSVIYIKSLVFVAVFYVNYYCVIDRTLGRTGGKLKFVLLNVFIMVAGLVLLAAMWELGRDVRPGDKGFRPLSGHRLAMMMSMLSRDFVMMALTVALSVALKFGDRLIKNEQHRQAEVAERRQTELQRLKSQLNPHFLFNTLNTIYALIAVDPDKAQKAVHELSRLLRYVLYENPEMVTLKRELEFIKSYISLMKMRLSGVMPLNVRLDAGDCAEMKIAPLLFVNLIENAFKHGNTGEAGKGIDIDVCASGEKVVCRVSNYYARNSDSDMKKEGIGLLNLERRLQLLYGKSAKMEIYDDEKGRHVVRLEIPLSMSVADETQKI